MRRVLLDTACNLIQRIAADLGYRQPFLPHSVFPSLEVIRINFDVYQLFHGATLHASK